jgi:hypothetical protein
VFENGLPVWVEPFADVSPELRIVLQLFYKFLTNADPRLRKIKI